MKRGTQVQFSRALFVICGCLILTACSSGPSAPLLRKSEADGEGAIIPDCRNVSRKNNVDKFAYGHAYTTWDSAWNEADVAAYTNSLGDVVPGIEAWAKNRLPQSATFCRAYSADFASVVAAVRQIMQETLEPLGYKVQFDLNGGWFLTDFFYQHDSRERWRDRFYIAVQEDGANHTVVRVFCELEIDRNMPGPETGYLRAKSVGRNEGWILTQVGRKLEK